MKNILIRNLTQKDNEIIEEIKKSTGEKTASKALLMAGSEYLLYKKRYYNLERRFFKLIEDKK
jgi:hypothetical protein